MECLHSVCVVVEECLCPLDGFPPFLFLETCLLLVNMQLFLLTNKKYIIIVKNNHITLVLIYMYMLLIYLFLYCFQFPVL